MSQMEAQPQIMRGIRVEKVTVHMGVGESGERLARAEALLEELSGQKPVRCMARKTLPSFNIRKMEPIGCKVTLRGAKATDFLKTALGTVDRKVYDDQFDAQGNFAFGIEEHTDFPGQEYDPEVGIFGMDVLAQLSRPGYRVTRRRAQKRRLPTHLRIKPEEAQNYLREAFGVEVI